MKIVILGAGALGAYFGARWEQVGQPVTFLVRPKRAQQLRTNGLSIHSVKGNYTLKQPTVVDRVDAIDQVDLVLLAVKGYHLPNTIEQLKVLVSKGAKVLPILNGIEHIMTLQSELGEEAVLGGTASLISTLDEDGNVVHSSSSHAIKFGPLQPSQTAICDQLASLSEQANMDALLSTDISFTMWSKYVFISAFSGITTATNLAIGEVRKYPQTLQIAERVLEEMKQLANAYGINITTEQVERGVKQLHNFDPKATSSMHQDRRKGLPLEVEHLQGGALRLAKDAGLQLPYTETIYGMIKPFERG
ncbi:ketopantoate reductase family protein [Aquibacillus sediminis]|uniref:ketopantoate reductase family protein n=1 Tax=Aquibacillus sediminis TaxID=2574734 RepID=UPI001109CBBE|nr:2-dehydropantoate 2-reductase [Aquibacillus sediminis]